MRRRAGDLLPLERRILEIAAGAHGEIHGFALARELAPDDDENRLVGHGTLYKALDRMREQGLLDARWEDADVAERQRRPRRRLYQITYAGRVAITTTLSRAAAMRVATTGTTP
ncbi:MAG: helix-turn-helix transcriptional regulator [Actinomycetota bacterium]